MVINTFKSKSAAIFTRVPALYYCQQAYKTYRLFAFMTNSNKFIIWF